MYAYLIDAMKTFPPAYASDGAAFWDDPHISKSMLENHLAPERDGASRRHGFIQASAQWIGTMPAGGKKLLDLGCGPGVYAQLLHDIGYQVTGIDLSQRSIAYARSAAADGNRGIAYLHQDYLTIDYQEQFHIAIMIYCDFGVLAPVQRKMLLEKVCAALAPGGLFIFDVFSPSQYNGFADETTVTYEEAGFWRPVPHLCIQRSKRYDSNVFLEQYTIVTEKELQTYHLWNKAFDPSELSGDLHDAGFTEVSFYGDVSGAPLGRDNGTICAVAKKSSLHLHAAP